MHSLGQSHARFEVVRLETREVPSASVQVVDSRLEISGDDAANRVEVRDDGRGNVTATVTTGSAIATGGGTAIRAVVIHTGSGDDLVDYRLTKNLLVAEELDIDLGDGNDRVWMDLYKGVSGVPLDLDLNGGAGRDIAEARFGPITNAHVNFQATLGTAADTMSVIFFTGLSGASHVTMDVAGNSGADRVDVNVMGKIDSAATLSIHAGNAVDSDDRLVVRYRGELDGKLNLMVDGAASGYGVQARFALDATSDGRLVVTVADRYGSYQSTAFVTDHSGGPKVTVLDRLGRNLTQPVGMRVIRRL